MMNFRYLISLPFAVSVIGLHCLAVAPTPTPAPTGSTAVPLTDSALPVPKMEVVKDGPEANLRQGMTADAVTALMGKPDSIKPMEAPTGKAEIWAYRNLINTTDRQFPASIEALTSQTVDSHGNTQTQQLGTKTVYKIERIRTFRRTSLLMFNGALLNQKSTVEQVRDYY